MVNHNRHAGSGHPGYSHMLLILALVITTVLMLTACSSTALTPEATFDQGSAAPTSAPTPETAAPAVVPKASPVIMKKTGSLPEFTDAEVAAARAVVVEYYRAIAAKDDEAILATLNPIFQSGRVILYGSETLTLLTAGYDSQDISRRDYKPGGEPIVAENIIVFRVSFRVDIPKGREEDSNFNIGVYDDWKMILTRESADSPWLIFDQGY